MIDKLFRANDKRVVQPLAAHLVQECIRENSHILLALDAPLGWPEAMRTELRAHTAGGTLATARQRMFSRMTDRFVERSTGKRPLDVGANLIAKTAHWALELLEQIREVGVVGRESRKRPPLFGAKSVTGRGRAGCAAFHPVPAPGVASSAASRRHVSLREGFTPVGQQAGPAGQLSRKLASQWRSRGSRYGTRHFRSEVCSIASSSD